MAAGIPTITVLLDSVDNNGTFPYDVSTYVRLVDGVNIGRGRGDEFTDVQPSSCSLTLENIDGRFTLGSTSGGYGAINIDRGIQVSYTINGVTTKRFTGYVQTWPVEWPDGSDVFAVARVTAVDRLARLSRRVLRSVVEQEYLLNQPSRYFTLGEAAGATTAGDTSGNGGPVLAMAGTGTAVVFGNATGPGTDGLTAAQFAGGKYLSFPGSRLTVPFNATMEAFFSTTGVTGVIVADSGFDSTVNPPASYSLTIQLNGAGKVQAVTKGGATVTSANAVNDGSTHHVMAVLWSTISLELFVDGVSQGTVVTSDKASGLFLDIGNGFTGTIAHAAGYNNTVLGLAYATAHANAGLTGFAGERSDQRIGRYAQYANIATTDQALETGIQTVPHLQIDGMTDAAATQKVMQAEGLGGLLFVRGDGKLVMQNRQHRALRTTPALTLTNNDISPDSKMSSDMQQVRNSVTASAGSNGAVQTAKNAASITAHELYPDDISGLLVNTDAQALDAANWRATVYAEPAARMPYLSLDLLTLTAAQAASVQALEISDRVQITGLPSQALNGTTTADLIVEGWQETLTAISWDMQFNTSNFSQASAWVLGDSALGVLGTTTRLSY